MAVRRGIAHLSDIEQTNNSEISGCYSLLICPITANQTSNSEPNLRKFIDLALSIRKNLDHQTYRTPKLGICSHDYGDFPVDSAMMVPDAAGHPMAQPRLRYFRDWRLAPWVATQGAASSALAASARVWSRRRLRRWIAINALRLRSAVNIR